MATAKYFLGRIIKLGNLTTQGIIDAITDPVVIRRGKYLYTFTDAISIKGVAEADFVFGKLTKYAADGEVRVVVEDQNTASPTEVPNLVFAESPFVYIPEYSGIAYQHVWNKLQRQQFERNFADLIEEKYQGFFVEVKIESITNLRTFIERVSTMDMVYRLEAKVHPSNPYFGPAWRDFRDYMRRRNLKEVQVKEEAESDEGLGTNIPMIARLILDSKEIDETKLRKLLEPFEGGIGDAAILMAADGYGKAKIDGKSNDRIISVHTKENQIAFQFDQSPDPVDLAEEAIKMLKQVTDDRHLGH